MNSPTREEAEVSTELSPASPMLAYATFKDYDKLREIDGETDVSTHDLLMAILLSADSIRHELSCIRKALGSS